MGSSQAGGSETVCRMEPSPARRAARHRIAAELAAAGYALPGTLTVRAYACGKPGCRCHAGPPRLHGPDAEWTRKIGGKTVTRRLTPRELAEYRPLFDNAKKLRALLAELQDLTLEIIEADSPRQPPEPETGGPENVGKARLTRGQLPSQTPFPQVRPKREYLTDLSDFCSVVLNQTQNLTRNWVSSGRAAAADDGFVPSAGVEQGQMAGRLLGRRGLGSAGGRCQAASAGVMVMTQPGRSLRSCRSR